MAYNHTPLPTFDYYYRSEEIPTYQVTAAPQASTEAPAQAQAQETDNSSSPNELKELKEQADKLVGEGKKAIVLKQWEEGVTKYGEALDLMRQLVGEFDPQMAPLLLSYGRALYELAFSQQGVMGKEEPSKEADDAVQQGASDAPTTKGNFVFSDDEAEADDPAAPTAGPSEAPSASLTPAPGTGAADPQGGREGENQDQGEDDEEPEDDYNAAWEVLDVARTIYQKIVEDAKNEKNESVREDKLNLAECYVALGDVSCETENFPQAVQDYTSALEIKSALLPASSRALASVHYQLATVLEFTPNRRSDSLNHVEKALESFKLRLQELKSASSSSSSENIGVLSEEVLKLSEKERENEIKDVETLLGDLEVKIEELKAAPPANDIVSESINHLLGQPDTDGFGSASGSGSGSGSTGGGDSGPVNDLTSMVKKKKPKAAAAVNNAAAATAAGATAAVQAVTEGAKELAENVQAQVAAAVEPGIVVEQVKEKVGEGAVLVGEAVTSVGEGLKRAGEGNGEGEDEKEEEEGRKAKKARME
ncbi:hypothetical protein IAT40_006685 [Kwoniella sp. CBS 6097]